MIDTSGITIGVVLMVLFFLVTDCTKYESEQTRLKAQTCIQAGKTWKFNSCQ